MKTNPAVPQWITQMADPDQAVAFFAYQSLLEEVLHAGKPGGEAAQAALVGILGEALNAQAASGGNKGDAAIRGNQFLAAAADARATPLHPTAVRNHLARLLYYLPLEAAVPPLATALRDLEVREMARQALELNPSPRATEALVAALNSAGPVFGAGVLNSLGKRHDPKSLPAVKKAAADRQPEIRTAALNALGWFPDAALDAMLAQAGANAARIQLAATLRAAGDRSGAEKVYRAVLDSNAPAPQKKAARLALENRV